MDAGEAPAERGDVMIEFWTTLIVADKKQLTATAQESLDGNCTYVANNYWIFEGDTDVLRDDGVQFKEVVEGAVPGLGGMSRDELVELTENVFGIKVNEGRAM